jgi:hypothetical protein
MLDSYDVLVSGEGWAELAELGFVEEVADAPAKKAAKKPTPMPEAEPAPLPEPEAEAEEKPAAAGANKTVSEMAREAAANSDEEPATVSGKAKKVLSKRKAKK